LVREQGIENLNARNIAKMLNSSTQPVFSYYENMADLKTDLLALVSSYHSGIFKKIEDDEDMMLNVGMAYVDFALEEPNLFRMLFMSDGFSGRKLTELFEEHPDDFFKDCPQNIEQAIAKKYDMDSPETNRIFYDIWLYAHGIASMLVANQMPTPRIEIEAMIRNMYNLLLTQAKRREE